MSKLGWMQALGLAALLAAMPASSNYKINNYGFGSGGVDNATSNNYSLNAITGETSGQPATGTNYAVKSGEVQTQQAHVPPAPAFTNPANYYSKLHVVINQSANAADAKYALAISSDNFSTTQYVQNDGTVGSALGLEDYQTYAAWGGASGSDVIGLNHSTTYQIKAKAISGKFTETGYGPPASATTSPPSLTFDIDVALTDSETSPPYTLNMGDLLPGSVLSASKKVWMDVDTNAENGVKVYIAGQSGGLTSQTASHTILALTGNLAGANEGFGIQSGSATQAAGGPLAATSPYNGTSDNVGTLSALMRELYSSSGPVSSGRTSVLIKAKTQTTTPSGSDYSETLTAIAAASY
jgi:hypothetical protein